MKLGVAAAALIFSTCSAAFAYNLEIEFMSTVGRGCRLTIVTREGGRTQSAVTHFQADRIDSVGRYIRGVYWIEQVAQALSPLAPQN